MVWLEPSHGGPSRVLVQSDAVLAVLTYVGGAWAWIARLGRLVPRPSRDLLYRVVARYRYRVFGRNPSCLLPNAEQKSRFLK